MHPPPHVCQAIARLHPQVRLAWMGLQPVEEGEINVGQFAIVQLYHWSDAGNVDDPLTSREFWDGQVFMNENGGWYGERIDRGPLFNKNGGFCRDFDPIERRPILMFGVNEQFGLDTRMVYSGEIVEQIKAWLIMGGQPLAERMVKQAKARGQETEDRLENLTRQMGDSLWEEASKTGEASITNLASRHIKKDDLTANYVKFREGKLGFEDDYLKKMPKKIRQAGGG